MALDPCRVLVTIGTRPEAIKMGPLLIRLSERPEFQVHLCVTGQHTDLVQPILSMFGLEPDWDLAVMAKNQDLFDVSSAVLVGMRSVIKETKPDLLLVHGDTTTAFMATLAGFYLGVPAGHVESGLRTGDLHSPFPEEFNRRSIDMLAKWHFCPTEESALNLHQEGIGKSSIFVTGNTVVDALLHIEERLDADERLLSDVEAGLWSQLGVDLHSRSFILATTHRRENFGLGLEHIVEALKLIANDHPEIFIVLPVHPNPNVSRVVHESLDDNPNILLIPPLEYAQFVYLMRKSLFIITDSGGIQEEAPALGKRVLLVREVTERPEAVRAGTTVVAGTRSAAIVAAAENELARLGDQAFTTEMRSLFGDGRASQRIVDALLNVTADRGQPTAPMKSALERK